MPVKGGQTWESQARSIETDVFSVVASAHKRISRNTIRLCSVPGSYGPASKANISKTEKKNNEASGREMPSTLNKTMEFEGRKNQVASAFVMSVACATSPRMRQASVSGCSFDKK